MKKICILICAFCFLLVLYFYIPEDTSNKISSPTNNLPSYEVETIKLSDNEQKTIKITNIMDYQLSFKTSDPTKIRIIRSKNYSITIEKVKAFSSTCYIALYIEGIEKAIDSLSVTCFNEITKIENISIFDKSTKEKVEKYQEGDYIIIFTLKRIDENKDYEEDTLILLEEYLKKELSKNLTLLEKQTNIKYSFYLDFDYVFIKTNYKTLHFNLNNNQYSITLEKAI